LPSRHPGIDQPETAHERTILSLRHTVGVAAKTVDLLDAVRRKRNQLNYERAGTTSAAEAGEMYALATELRTKVVRWLAKHHRPLCPKDLNINGA
jgi:hypothetical protein